jgi:hypothetical protein
MSHKFPKIDPPINDNEPTSSECVYCGITRYRLKSGAYYYINDNGGRQSQPTSKCGKSIFVDTNQKQIEQINQTKISQQPQNFQTNNKLTSPEARLLESLTIINLMYEDMVVNNIRTKSRDIAGRFLHSQGYSETIKQLHLKTENK